MTRIAIAVIVVTLSGCTFPVTKMEPVNPTTSGASHAGNKQANRGAK